MMALVDITVSVITAASDVSAKGNLAMRSRLCTKGQLKLPQT